ncbi:MAG TPA: gluconate 2-dehydrogenase subunit 3 family protein [Terriglobia bacterium]|nr:gluconate 2-dehydrogenase subunit 3 family protein [Terriglobia bacterium]
MERRTALKIVALSALTKNLGTAQAAVTGHCAMPSGTAWSATAESYKLQFFTESENALLDQLTEMIIPADGHSPGAHAAQASLFADLMVAAGDEPAKSQWRNGLARIQEEAKKSSLSDALAQAAELSDTPSSDVGQFFVALKQMTVNGYYTSEIGIHQDMGYIGNTYLAEFPGCTHPEHQ